MGAGLLALGSVETEVHGFYGICRSGPLGWGRGKKNATAADVFPLFVR